MRHFIKIDASNVITHTLSGEYDAAPDGFIEVDSPLDVCWTWDAATKTAAYVKDDANGA